MSMRHKLRVVIRHEYMTIVKQPSFWISLVAIPLIMLGIVLISYFTNASNDKDVDPNKNDLRIAMIDESGLISRDAASAYKMELKSGAALEKMTQDVKSGELDGLIVYPDDLSKTGKYQVVADNTEEDNTSVVTALAKILLQQSLLEPLESKELVALALSGGESQVSSYKKGELTPGFASYIVPGSFLVIFYLVLVFAVGYALTSVSDEKENRSIEMVLSYVKPQTLILGKLVGVVLVTLTQIAFFAVMGIVGYFVARALGNELSLPFSLSDVVFEPTAVLFGLAFLVVGFIFYVSVMATIGAIFPSAKEASGFSTVFFILPAVPFWGSKALTSDPSSMFTQIVTYFPFSAPTASLLRNAAGNLTVVEGLISLAILILAAMGTVLLAGKAFRLGTLEYNSRIKLTALFKR